MFATLVLCMEETMTADTIRTEFEKHIQRLGELKGFLNKLQHEKSFSTFLMRPVINTLLVGVDFLSSQLTELKGRPLE